MGENSKPNVVGSIMPNTKPKTKANTKPKTKANNEPYRKVKITMWNDPKFCELSALPPSGQSLFVYLLTSPFTGIIPGLFKAGRAAMAEELGWETEDFDLALGEALALGMVKADMKARVFWLPNAARHNPPASGNVVKSWVRAFELLPECELKWEARESLKAACYGVSETMGKAFDMAIPLPKDKPKAMSSGIQLAVNSKQILKDQNTKTLLSGAEKDQPPTKQNAAGSYPEEFETLWHEYPKREGANPKNKAHSCWKARKFEGVSEEAMLEGTLRYRQYCEMRGQAGTEFVMQAQRFYGKERAFENDWQVNPGGLNHAKNIASTIGNNGESIAERQLRAGREQWARERGHTGVAPVGTHDQNLQHPVDSQEWQSSLGPLGETDWGHDE